MFRFIVLATCFGEYDTKRRPSPNPSVPAALASAGVAKKKIVVREPEAQGTHLGEVSVGLGGGLGGGHSKTYASGAELTSLAHTSALQAKAAVQGQSTAGSQAAFGAKSSLAQAALGVSTTSNNRVDLSLVS